MKDDQQLMKSFVKIVEKYPDIYDNSLDGYRTRHSELAWETIAEQVRNDIKEECTVEELKIKWKGIRSSFNRYKNKLLSGNTSSCKKYYLYDYLQFLEPFTKPKGLANQGPSERVFEDCYNYADGNANDSSNEYNPLDDWQSDIKPDLTQKVEEEHKLNIMKPLAIKKYTRDSVDSKESKNIKVDERITDDDNEDLQFFKSILPDIKNFTTKEKRKLKMGILQLIDVVESERKRQRPNE